MPIREREHASCEAQWLAAEEDAAGTPGTSQMGRCYPCSEVTAEGNGAPACHPEPEAPSGQHSDPCLFPCLSVSSVSQLSLPHSYLFPTLIYLLS